MRKTLLVLQPAPVNDVPPVPPSPTNEMLLARIKERDGEAFLMLFRRHNDLVRDVIARCVSDEDECEDVLREVFEFIRDRAEHYTPDKGRALGWMMTLARRRAAERALRTPLRAEREVSAPERRAASEATPRCQDEGMGFFGALGAQWRTAA